MRYFEKCLSGLVSIPMNGWWQNFSFWVTCPFKANFTTSPCFCNNMSRHKQTFYFPVSFPRSVWDWTWSASKIPGVDEWTYKPNVIFPQSHCFDSKQPNHRTGQKKRLESKECPTLTMTAFRTAFEPLSSSRWWSRSVIRWMTVNGQGLFFLL